MLALAATLIVVGIVMLFLIPIAGVVVGIVGIILAVLFALGFGRRAATRSGP